MGFRINEIQLFEILKEKLGEKEAQDLVSFVVAKVKETSEWNLNDATKHDHSSPMEHGTGVAGK